MPRRTGPNQRRSATKITRPRRRPSIYTRRGVLAVLIIAAMAMVTVSYRAGGDPFGEAQMRVLQVVAPIERGLSRAWAPVQGAADWVTRVVHATNRLPEVEQQLEVAEAQIAITRDVEAENERLRDIVAIKERGRFPDGYSEVVGSVIARPPTAIDRSLVIDLGSDDGVSVNDPVMVTRGLIGRVEAVSANAARVGLVIDRAQAVSASVVDSNATGVLRPVSNEGTPVMELAYVSQRVRVAPGDIVVTSGWSTGDLHSIYPRGIPFGVVSSVGSSPADLYKTVQVTPFADFDRIDEVIVLVPTTATRAVRDYIDPAAGGVVGAATDGRVAVGQGKEAARGAAGRSKKRARRSRKEAT